MKKTWTPDTTKAPGTGEKGVTPPGASQWWTAPPVAVSGVNAAEILRAGDFAEDRTKRAQDTRDQILQASETLGNGAVPPKTGEPPSPKEVREASMEFLRHLGNEMESPDPSRWEQVAVDCALRNEAHPHEGTGRSPDPIAQGALNDTGERARFGMRIRMHMRAMIRAIEDDRSFGDFGVLALDYYLVQVLRSNLGATGERLADQVLDGANERVKAYNREADQQRMDNPQVRELWALWTPHPRTDLVPALAYLATAEWDENLREELERKARKRERERLAQERVGAPQTEIFDTIMLGTLAPGAEVRGPDTRDTLPATAGDAPRIAAPRENASPYLAGEAGGAVGWFHGWTMDQLWRPRRALDRLRSPAGIKLLCAGADRIAYQLAMGARSPTVTRHPAPTHLARYLGIKTGELQELLEAGTDYRALAPGGKTLRGLFSSGSVAPTGGRPAETVLTWNVAIFQGRGWKTPIPDPDNMPRFGAQLHRRGLFAYLLFHRYLAEAAEEYAETGAAKIDLAEIRRVAEIRRKTTWHTTMDVLLGHRGEGPFLLPGESHDSFRLADEHRHRFLVTQGERLALVREGGRQRARIAKREAGKFARKRRR